MLHVGPPIVEGTWRLGSVLVECPFCSKRHRHVINKDDPPAKEGEPRYLDREAPCSKGSYCIRVTSRP